MSWQEGELKKRSLEKVENKQESIKEKKIKDLWNKILDANSKLPKELQCPVEMKFGYHSIRAKLRRDDLYYIPKGPERSYIAVKDPNAENEDEGTIILYDNESNKFNIKERYLEYDDYWEFDYKHLDRILQNLVTGEVIQCRIKRLKRVDKKNYKITYY